VLVRHLVANDFVPVIFGAGHVGRALVGILAPLTGRLLWCDSRREEFPEQVPGRVEIAAEEPLEVIRRAPPGAYFVVMTHSHALDLTLCEAILKRGSFRYLGVIGSRSKRARFEQQLRAQGIAEEDLTRMICQIGVDGIRDKQPAAIAVAVAAQLLQVRER
jgi:xanthine dehydrogenase accessory factor